MTMRLDNKVITSDYQLEDELFSKGVDTFSYIGIEAIYDTYQGDSVTADFIKDNIHEISFSELADYYPDEVEEYLTCTFNPSQDSHNSVPSVESLSHLERVRMVEELLGQSLKGAITLLAVNYPLETLVYID